MSKKPEHPKPHPRAVSRDKFAECMKAYLDHCWEKGYRPDDMVSILAAFDEAQAQTPGYFEHMNDLREVHRAGKKAIDAYCTIMGYFINGGRRDLAERVAHGAGVIKSCLDEFLGEPVATICALRNLKKNMAAHLEGKGDSDQNEARIQGIQDSVNALIHEFYR